MKWVTLSPAPKNTRSRPAVAISVSRAGKVAQRLYVTVQPDAGLDWWTQGARVTVQYGEDGLRRFLRVGGIGGEFELTTPGGKARPDGMRKPPVLQVPGLAGWPAAGIVAQAAEWEKIDHLRLLLITLPPIASLDGTAVALSPLDVTEAPAVSTTSATPKPSGPAASAHPPAPIKAKPVARPTPPPASPTARYAPAARPAPIPAGAVRQPIERSYAEIQEWAVSHRLGSVTAGFHLATVNQKRISLGERPFIIRKTATGLARAAALARAGET